MNIDYPPRREEESTDFEEKIEDILTNFPDDLRVRFENELDTSLASYTEKEQYLYLQEKKNKRDELFNEGDNPKNIEVSKEMPLAIQASIERSSENHSESFLGSGETGEVLSSMRQPTICYKVFYEKSEQLGQNSLAEEIDLQIDTYNELSGENDVRIPKAYAFIRNQFADAIMMEKIDGVSIREVIMGTKDLPVSFDMDSFSQKIRSFVTKMNAAGIYHRDLSAANIMVDQDGEPWVIDFGRSKKSYPEDEDAYVFTSNASKGEKMKFTPDDKHIESVLVELKRILNN